MMANRRIQCVLWTEEKKEKEGKSWKEQGARERREEKEGERKPAAPNKRRYLLENAQNKRRIDGGCLRWGLCDRCIMSGQ